MNDLKSKAAYGIKWSGFSNVFVAALRLIQIIVLARLLNPGDFGLLGMVLVVLSLGQIFTDMGVSYAIIWKQDATRDQLSSLYWLNIILGIVVASIVIAISPLIAGFYNEPRLKLLVIWSSLIFLITPIGLQFQMLLQRDLKFRRLATVEMGSALIGVVFSVVLAVAGSGVYSLIWGQIATTTTRALAFLAIGFKEWRPRLFLRIGDMKDFIRFGFYQMGGQTLSFITTNVDYIIIGKFLGSEALGIYLVAYRLVVEPFKRINPILTSVAFPIFALRQNDNSTIRRGYYELSKLISVLIFPILALIASTAPILVPVAFGQDWVSAVPLAQILILLGAFRTLANPSGSILYAKGRSDIIFYWTLAAAVLNISIFLLVVNNGLYAIAWAEAILHGFYLFIMLFILKRAIGLKFFEYSSHLLRPTIASLFMGILVYSCYMILNDFIRTDLILLIALIILGLGFYILLIIFIEKEAIKEYWSLSIGRRSLSN